MKHNKAFISFFLHLTFVCSIIAQQVKVDHSFNSLDTGFGNGDGANRGVFATAIPWAMAPLNVEYGIYICPTSEWLKN